MTGDSQRIELGWGHVDLLRRVVVRNGQEASLSPLEARFLTHLYAHRDRAVSRDELLREVWEYRPGAGSPGVIDSLVRLLRKKVEPNPGEPRVVLAVRGVGFRFGGQMERRARASALPVVPGEIVGREGLVQVVEEHLGAGALAVELWGPPGVGTTRLALEVAQRAEQRGVRVLWVDCAEHEGGEALALLLGVERGQVRAALREQGVGLVVLDAALDTGLPSPGTPLLATGRRRLGAPGSAVVHVHPLEVRDAVAMARTLAHRAGVQLAQDTEAWVAPAEGLPFAIELLVGHAAVWGPDAGADAFLGEVPALQRVLDRSWRALTPAERQGLVALCALSSPVPVDVVEAVVPRSVVVALTRASLAQRDVEGGVSAYRVVRASVVATEAEALDRARVAWATVLARRLELSQPVCFGPRDALALWPRAALQVPPHALPSAVRGLDAHVQALGPLAMVDVTEVALPLAPLEVRPRIEDLAIYALLRSGRTEEGAARAQALWEEWLRDPSIGHARFRLGPSLGLLGRKDDARHLQSTLVAGLVTDDPGARGVVLLNQGAVAAMARDWQGAVAAYEAALPLLAVAGEGRNAYAATVNLATALIKSGDIDRAESLLRPLLEAPPAQASVFSQRQVPGFLALIALERGRCDQARALVARSLEHEVWEPFSVATAHNVLAHAALAEGDWEEAERRLSRAIEVSSVQADPDGVAELWCGRALTALLAGRAEHARLHAETARRAGKGDGPHLVLVDWLQARARGEAVPAPEGVEATWTGRRARSLLER